jgi:uncharacterized protein
MQRKVFIPPTVVSLQGNELGSWGTMRELRHHAMQYAKQFIGQSVINLATGYVILIGKSGIDHTLAGAQDTLIRTIPAIPELLKVCLFIGSEKDKNSDPNILAVEKYAAQVSVGGVTLDVVLTVKQYTDKRRYYDHGFVK